MILTLNKKNYFSDNSGSDWKTGVYYVPGAGTYNPLKPDRNNLPSWKIGTGPRGLQSLYNTPGPGQYENNNTALVGYYLKTYIYTCIYIYIYVNF